MAGRNWILLKNAADGESPRIVGTLFSRKPFSHTMFPEGRICGRKFSGIDLFWLSNEFFNVINCLPVLRVERTQLSALSRRNGDGADESWIRLCIPDLQDSDGSACIHFQEDLYKINLIYYNKKMYAPKSGRTIFLSAECPLTEQMPNRLALAANGHLPLPPRILHAGATAKTGSERTDASRHGLPFEPRADRPQSKQRESGLRLLGGRLAALHVECCACNDGSK